VFRVFLSGRESPIMTYTRDGIAIRNVNLAVLIVMVFATACPAQIPGLPLPGTRSGVAQEPPKKAVASAAGPITVGQHDGLAKFSK
jgi:hypothetical protein